MPDDCHEKTSSYCHGKSTDNCISMSCACSIQMVSFSGQEWCDPGFSYFGKSSSRSNAKQSTSSSTSSGIIGAFIPKLSAVPNNVGPPDPDVVEYLPPSAKQIFQVLASDGPLTQKDLISKTDLPPRTVRYALGRLKGEEMLEERFCFRDARQSLYSLNGMDTR
jgi:DNA-binding transcriptional ArsR family regulator